MKATRWEYRLRELLAVLVYVVGFWAPWERYTGLVAGGSTLWTAASALLFRQRLLGFSASSRALLLISTAAAVGATLVRWWAGSYPQPGFIQAQGHGELVVGGPFRFVRQPAAWAYWLHVAALALLMPPTGALAAVILAIVLEFRLAGYQESEAAAREGTAYAAYLRLVPRFLPASVRPGVAGTAVQPSWLAGLLSSVLFLGTAAAFIVEGATYNSTTILRWVLVAFGLQLIANAAQGPGRQSSIA